MSRVYNFSAGPAMLPEEVLLMQQERTLPIAGKSETKGVDRE